MLCTAMSAPRQTCQPMAQMACALDPPIVPLYVPAQAAMLVYREASMKPTRVPLAQPVANVELSLAVSFKLELDFRFEFDSEEESDFVSMTTSVTMTEVVTANASR